MAKTSVPSYKFQLFLRNIISSDYNTTRGSVSSMVWKDYPIKSLSKNSYPRISIFTVDETGDPVAIGNITSTENMYILQIDIWMWNKPKDALAVTVGGNTMAGTRARDEITRDVLHLIRNNFYTNANMTGYYDYRVRAVRIIPFDEDDGILRRQIEIEFKEMDTST